MKICVVGDVMLDVFIEGPATRLSPEASWAPVINGTPRYRLGGAGFTAKTLTDLGADVTLITGVGNDIWGDSLLNLCSELTLYSGIADRTTVKLSVVATDAGRYVPLCRADIDATDVFFPNPVEDILDDADIIVISDYNKGVLEGLVVNFPHHVPIIADIKPQNIDLIPSGCLAITPNTKEAEQIAPSLEEILKISRAQNVIVTKGADGCVVYDGKKEVHLSSTVLNGNILTVSGAGDVFTSVLAFAYTLGHSIKDAATIAEQSSRNYVYKGVVE